MSEPLVSIMVITYNHVDFIGAALDSALAQTYPNIEIIVGDDGSTDGTAEIVDSYAERFPQRIRAMPRKVNTGVTGINENSSRVLRACRGKYLCVLEGDDSVIPREDREAGGVDGAGRAARALRARLRGLRLRQRRAPP